MATGSTKRANQLSSTYNGYAFLLETHNAMNKKLTVFQTLLYLIRRSYGYIYHLMISSEPVSEALLPVYNQLQTLKRCLIEVEANGGVSSARELFPYSMKVYSYVSVL